MGFLWDDGNRSKLDAHNLDPEEVEEAMLDPNRMSSEAQNTPTERRYALIGATATDKVLRVIYTYRDGDIRVITAFPPSEKERRRYWLHRSA